MSWCDCALLRVMGSRQPCARGTLRAGNTHSAVLDLDSGTPSHGILGAVSHREACQELAPTRMDKDVPPCSPYGAASRDGAFSSIPPK